MSLEGFKVITLVGGDIALTISKTGISFSQAAIIQLGKPRYVRLLINEKDKELAVQATDKNDNEKTSFFNPSRKTIAVRWGNKLLRQKIVELMHWNPNYMYKIRGDYLHKDQALLFKLNEADSFNKVNKKRN
ncbi:MAG: hypothetical protein ACLRX6_02570 [Limosilactobacillus pontis]|uniref:Uncharacterized protein n=1 Tax=Limosilactobacillus pontis TaxID=35787 RepID=A0A2J6NPU8_9LACO|nr:hypothetical protein [Limosilactobacillus pontis]PMB83352.1 hypothetical protein CK797_00735 [Limosilactobacillus pontis]